MKQVILSAGENAEVVGTMRSLTIGRSMSAGHGRWLRVRVEAMLELMGPVEDIEAALERLQEAVSVPVKPQ